MSQAPRPNENGSGTLPDRVLWPSAFLVLGVFAALSWRLRAPGIWAWRRDDALYLLLSRSVKAFEYLDAHLVGAPPHIQFPPVYPSFLALLSLPFGENLDLFLAVNIVFSAAALILLFDVVRRVWSQTLAFLVLGLAALLPAWLGRHGPGVGLLAEAPFAALTMAALWICALKPRTTRWMTAAAVLALLAALTRSVGVTMIGALALLWILERRWKAVVLLAVAATLTEGAWLSWTIFADTGIVGRSYIADAAFAGRRVGDDSGFLLVLFDRVQRNASFYLTRALPLGFALPTLPGTPLDNIAGLAALGSMALMGLRPLWDRWRAGFLYLVLYGGLLLVWPWTVERFLIPVLCLVVLLVLAGAWEVGRRWLGSAFPVIVAVVLIALAGRQDLATTRSFSAQCDRSGGMRTCGSPREIDFHAGIDRLNEVLEPGSVVLAAKDATVAYLTDRVVLQPYRLGRLSPDRLAAALREQGVTHVFLSRGISANDDQLAEIALAACTIFRSEGSFGEHALVLALAPGGAGACSETAIFADRFPSP